MRFSATSGAESSSGVCFGYTPTGNLPLQQLRAGLGDPLRVIELSDGDVPPVPAGAAPLTVWTRRPENPFSARLFGLDGVLVFDVDGMGQFLVDPAGSTIGVPRGCDPYRREARMWGVPAVLCFGGRGDVPLHAAAVGVGEAALLLVGPSRQGKTTLAAAFLAAGYRLLAEDTACVRLDGSPVVVPGPPTLRIRPDVWGAFAIPDTDVVRRDRDRMHLMVRPSARGSGDPVPLAGIVFLHVQPDGPVDLAAVAPLEAMSNLWVSSHNLPDDPHRGERFSQLVSLASTVALWDLRRPLEYGCLPDVVSLLVKRCIAG